MVQVVEEKSTPAQHHAGEEEIHCKPYEVTCAEFKANVAQYECLGPAPARSSKEITQDLAASEARFKKEFTPYWHSVLVQTGTKKGLFKARAARNLETEAASARLNAAIDGMRSQLDKARRYERRHADALGRHRFWIEHAVREGKAIPDHVLAEYPDLAYKFRARYGTAQLHTETPWCGSGNGRLFGQEAGRMPEDVIGKVVHGWSDVEDLANQTRIKVCVNGCAGIARPSEVPELVILVLEAAMPNGVNDHEWRRIGGWLDRAERALVSAGVMSFIQSPGPIARKHHFTLPDLSGATAANGSDVSRRLASRLAQGPRPMVQHTAEPWHCGHGNGEGNIFAADGRMRFETGRGTVLYPLVDMNRKRDLAKAKADEARIVECVNACAGIKDPSLVSAFIDLVIWAAVPGGIGYHAYHRPFGWLKQAQGLIDQADLWWLVDACMQ